ACADRDSWHPKPPTCGSGGGRVHELEAIALKDEVAGARGAQPDPDLLVIRRRSHPREPVELRLPAPRFACSLAGLVAPDEFLGARDVILLCVVLLLANGATFAP